MSYSDVTAPEDKETRWKCSELIAGTRKSKDSGRRSRFCREGEGAGPGATSGSRGS